MTTALDRILEYKIEEVATLKKKQSASVLENRARNAPQCRNFADRMKSIAQTENALICEIKRRSPSAGLIRTIDDPAGTARQYEAGGAACISVLTDGPSFGGSPEDLDAVRNAIDLPILRKDFMIDVIQVLEARAMGADAILIIMAAVDDARADDLNSTADDLGMSVLIEVHHEQELERALCLNSPLIGINNRDLKSFKTDLTVTERLSSLIPSDRLLISESGIKSEDDVSRLRNSGARGFLIGESFMVADNIPATVQRYVNVR